MTAFGASAYRRTGIDTGVAAASPHQLILMLFDGALDAVKAASTLMHSGQVAAKGVAIGKAVRIVEEGLKASIDRRAGGAIAQQLASLYDYMVMRLLQANLRNDERALAEVQQLLDGLRAAWAQIGNAPAAPTASSPWAAAAGSRAAPAHVAISA
ncbi:MAG: flagellar export chaperone FliS [Burkholderiaceae bacterium]|jgi:flagellar protein FliS|nr:flagellar export chaperone FliS [Burkholderiaceae bacterium]